MVWLHPSVNRLSKSSNSKSIISFQLTFTGSAQSAGIMQKAFASVVAHDLNKASEHTSPAAPPVVPEKAAQHHIPAVHFQLD